MTLPSYVPTKDMNDGPKVREDGASVGLATEYTTSLGEDALYVARSLLTIRTPCTLVIYKAAEEPLLGSPSNSEWRPRSCHIFQVLKALESRRKIVHIFWECKELDSGHTSARFLTNGMRTVLTIPQLVLGQSLCWHSMAAPVEWCKSHISQTGSRCSGEPGSLLLCKPYEAERRKCMIVRLVGCVCYISSQSPQELV